MLEGFDFGALAMDKQLKGTLEPLKRYNALEVPASYFAEAMQRLRERYLNVPLDAVLHPLSSFGVARVAVATYQAISGAGKTFASWPEMVDNVIPFIKGEEEKSEREPLKIWGTLVDGRIRDAAKPVITAQCIRVPASDGHMAAVFVSFDRKPERAQILDAWRAFVGKPQTLGLPSAPTPFLTYFEDDARPQTRLDRDLGRGMGVSIGRLRSDALFDYRFVCLSHNTVRGAAGGAILTAELLKAEGYLAAK